MNTTSAANRSPSGSGPRRVRSAFFADGNLGSPAMRYPVAVLIDALAAAKAALSA
jgi:hypothetical protein